MNESSRIIVLMYHRVDNSDTDPWGICVSPEHFDEQVKLITNRFPIITAEQAVQQATTGHIPQTSVCITFDDGYADNYTNALPVLKRCGCPAAFFIATAFTGSQMPFWWDELELICLQAKQLPASMHLSLKNTSYTFPFETSLTGTQWQKHQQWKWYDEPPTLRCDSFLQVWNLLRPLPDSDIKRAMTYIRSWADATVHSRLPMNEDELQKLSLDKLTSIGLHTHTHLDLASQSRETQTEDILAGKHTLLNRFGTENSLLAYPYGKYTETTLSVVNSIGMTGCFTTEQVPVMAGSDVRKLGRYQVCDWNRQQFEKQLSKWIQE